MYVTTMNPEQVAPGVAAKQSIRVLKFKNIFDAFIVILYITIYNR